ncbi:tRNA (adenosine(37)-N6)-threonylcarbamoyltransferase complex ATPase subunit type 1 TsaE [Alsobacter sp. SYSU M60028]|uniref:tRNA threonylcarbamoyladenosine biosynthesis protein TsaE n=1 Tax=Alsobacter ponti TaxID=2962936 RepID=A0ABT1LBJ1_9HYPH|nr:tRNA (adenosine(37)-N6)-threonylcarbamoyltransferase complex ATPase subunit type 1 TsaE [Alsobacter ponti]MCP8938824.1 tRNA (adenosine(37)-N6)-threonylcarbamoyltransferase complex ATPase subunit type 1 TsaE [Alsobacter ponti]
MTEPAPAPRNGLPEASWTVRLADEAATERLALDLAPLLAAGDLVTLTGDLGAGKTTFARHLIRALTGEPGLEVPSPTFTLMQAYEGERYPIVHADLYRIGGADDLEELGWEEAADNSLVLVEWPERAGFLVTAERLDVALRLDPAAGPGARVAVLTGHGAWAARVARAGAIHRLLAAAGWGDARREYLLGDASTRAYERLTLHGETAILMISPRRPDGPPVRMGRAYSSLARLAESVHPFVAMANGLRQQGFSAPAIIAQDLETGLLLIEDLGDGGVLSAGAPDEERYAESAALLANLHRRDLPTTLPVEPGRDYALPPYDLDAMLIEVELLLDWYLPHVVGANASGSVRSAFVNLWRAALEPIVDGPKTWVLRDYHSPNLIWLPEREGLARVGLIDFQDAVIGHPAYDVVSLMQDARVTVPQELELKLLGHYARQRRLADPAFDMSAFAHAYAALGAQRNTKILGIFARLDRRDGKPQYLKHLPRIEAYLRRDLSHPALADLKAWYEANLPSLFPTA